MKKEEIISFLKELAKDDKYEGKKFIINCLNCGSSEIDISSNGEAGPVTTGSYTASFDGEVILKCKECGVAQKLCSLYVPLNGVFG